MDTPDKTQITPASSLSKFEDSPVFKYIDSLSPIELAKSRQTNNVFNSLAFLSPSSLFPSPQIGSYSESRFSVKRLSAASNSRDFQSSNNESNASEGALKAVEKSDLCNDQQGCLDTGTSSEVIGSNLLDEQYLTIELPRTLKYDCGSPDGKLVPCDEILKNSSAEMAGKEASPLKSNKNEWEGRKHSYESEKDLRKIRRIKCTQESTGYNWVAVVSDVADFLTMNSSAICENTEGQDQGTDSSTTPFISTILQFPQHVSNNLENAETGDSSGSGEQGELGEPGTDQTPAVLSTCLQDKLVVSDSGLKKDDEGEKCSQPSRQRSIRRRCLVFEKSPGFGLLLNSLSNTSKGENSLSKLAPSFMKRGDNAQDIKAVGAENSTDTPAGVAGNEVDHSSPEKKRQKFENVEESASCKRCNCKRSKCLKLYCDCFAAGLYCIEPCSCQDCFNKPIHEKIVLEARSQIESRNPLAFAPKVIRSTESVLDSAGETNKTPASARHKRGCNCKKSSCLKKYCECFQAGVGCSFNCRCEGCKNKFGRKDGADDSESEGEDLETLERNASERNSLDIAISKGEEHSDPSASSSDISRLPFSSRGKLSRSFPHSLGPSSQFCATQELGSSDSSTCRSKLESHLQAIQEDEPPEVLKNRKLSLVVKPTSPNCKRISPPHHECISSAAWHGRKLILRSVPPFPSFSPS